ncbi:hypothetical protein scyTo_0005286 [Scyliorhinus torazame]|uniref:Uncharacterized protein n=1 Tax=Scyliorhinus torazame TaxID=75743 RepID=A0A401P5B0_SCYTO|nr:hypothetical protein [Scyliorhinus torazame]
MRAVTSDPFVLLLLLLAVGAAVMLLLLLDPIVELQWGFHVRAVKAAGTGCAPCAMRSGPDGEILARRLAYSGSRRIQATRPIGGANQNNRHDVIWRRKGSGALLWDWDCCEEIRGSIPFGTKARTDDRAG